MTGHMCEKAKIINLEIYSAVLGMNYLATKLLFETNNKESLLRIRKYKTLRICQHYL